VPPALGDALRRHEAAERVRQEQQGYGRPIVSHVASGQRLVAVGRTLYWNSAQKWLVFPDFLVDYLKDTLGRNWGVTQVKAGSSHPIFRWLNKLKNYHSTQASGVGMLKSAPAVGFAAAVLRLAYSLYLIAHHDQVPKQFIRRLREASTFLPAYYETLVGAVFAVAGFELSVAEVGRTNRAVPEFRVRAKRSGRSYVVEAKFRQKWSAAHLSLSESAFRDELSRYLRSRLINATEQLRKAADRNDGRVLWIELNLPTVSDEEDWRGLVDFIAALMKDLERTCTEIAPTYVVLTNHTFLAAEDAPGAASFGVLFPFNMPDFVPNGSPVEIEEALASYDRHRDIIWASQCIGIAAEVPITFDGQPSDLLDSHGRNVNPIRIGERIAYPGPDGGELTGIIEEVSALDNEVAAVVKGDDGRSRHIVKVPLTEAEARAVARHGDAVFGKPNVSRRLEKDDLFGLYDWMREAYASATKEQLLALIPPEHRTAEMDSLSREDLLARVCRGYTRSMYIRAQGAEKLAEEKGGTPTAGK
jgi:hypothetical protein